MGHKRGGDDDFGIDQLLVKSRVLALLVGGGDQSVALLLNPLSQTKLILGGTKKAGLLFGVLTALFSSSIRFQALSYPEQKDVVAGTYVIEDHKNLAL
jgi:hypothetical protein